MHVILEGKLGSMVGVFCAYYSVADKVSAIALQNMIIESRKVPVVLLRFALPLHVLLTSFFGMFIEGVQAGIIVSCNFISHMPNSFPIFWSYRYINKVKSSVLESSYCSNR